MTVFDRVREMFSSGETQSFPATYNRNKAQDTSIASNTIAGSPETATNVTSSLANFLIGLTDFNSLSERDIYEQMYVWEPEIAAVVNKVAEMVRTSFDYFMLIDDAMFDKIPDEVYKRITDDDYAGELDPELRQLLGKAILREEMKDTANEIWRLIDIPSIAETYAAVLYMHGELYLKKHDDLSLTILPNNRITIIDRESRIDAENDPNTIIMDENFLVIDENIEFTRQVYKKGEFIHVKLSDVPLNILDTRHRMTYGIYSLSPLHRCVIPVWMKRQVYIIETIWRWANVPREHHIVNAEAFNVALFPGTPVQKRRAADRALRGFIRSYSEGLKKLGPDQKHVTSSNVEIKNLEHAGNSYMDASGILEQINAGVWDGIGMPPSVIRGKSDGSYASELIIASGASLRVEQIAKKIGKIILENMKERLLQINPEYPVNHLDIKIHFELAASRLEKLKTGQLMKDIGIFTPIEIREEIGYAPLTEQQVKEDGLVTNGQTQIVHSIEELSLEHQQATLTKFSGKAADKDGREKDFGGLQGGRSDGKVNYPTTFKSESTQGTNSAENISKSVLYK